jgi:hypothetical protein
MIVCYVHQNEESSTLYNYLPLSLVKALKLDYTLLRGGSRGYRAYLKIRSDFSKYGWYININSMCRNIRN